MSKIWSAESASATPVSGFGDFGSLNRQGGGFRTIYGDEPQKSWQSRTPGQSGMGAGSAGFDNADAAHDPIEEAAREAFLQGFREGERVAREAAEEDNSARLQLSAAISHIAQCGEGTLSAMLSQAVVRLVGQIVGDVEIDETVLRDRCAAVAACIDSDDARAVLEVNPQDMHLLEEEALGVTLSPNADLTRGTVRLATSDGWVEDGPDVRLARLKTLLDDMETRR